VGDDIEVEGIYVSSDVHIQDAQAVANLGTTALELSCGYSCVVVPESGTFDGLPYTQRQTQIKYNHVGMGPEGWGRAGEKVRVYFDANKDVPVHHAQGCYGEDMSKFLPVNRMDSAGAPVQQPAPQAPAPSGTGPEISRADFDSLRGELAAAKARVTELEASKNDAAQRASVRVRMDLLRVAEAQGLEGDKMDALSDDQLRCAVLAKVRPDIKTDGESSEYVRAAFDFARKSDDNAKQAAAGETPPLKTDGADAGPIGSKIEKVRLDSIAKARNAWKDGK
jgi:hypothetical protein